MMKFIYWLFTLLRIPKDTVDDENEIYVDYLKGYGWLKPNTAIPADKFSESERTPERLKYMEENNIKIEHIP